MYFPSICEMNKIAFQTYYARIHRFLPPIVAPYVAIFTKLLNYYCLEKEKCV